MDDLDARVAAALCATSATMSRTRGAVGKLAHTVAEVRRGFFLAMRVLVSDGPILGRAMI